MIYSYHSVFYIHTYTHTYIQEYIQLAIQGVLLLLDLNVNSLNSDVGAVTGRRCEF